MRIFWGIIFIIGCVGVIKYRREIHKFTGDIGFFERNIGGTENGITLLAIIGFILALMYMTGNLQIGQDAQQYFTGE